MFDVSLKTCARFYLQMSEYMLNTPEQATDLEKVMRKKFSPVRVGRPWHRAAL